MDTQTVVAIVASTVTSTGVIFAGLVAVIRMTVYRPLADKLDRMNRLLGSHTHDEDGDVVAPIVNGGQR